MILLLMIMFPGQKFDVPVLKTLPYHPTVETLDQWPYLLEQA